MLKNAAIFLSGTVVAQIIALAAIPLLSRVYSPADFGLFGLFTSILSILGAICCLRYELAIVLPERAKEAAQVFATGATIALGISFLVLIVVLVARHNIALALNAPFLSEILWWLPLSLFGFALYQLFNYWTTRRDRFKQLSAAQILRASAVVSTQLGSSSLLSSGSGLVAGQLVGQWVANLVLARQALKKDGALLISGFKLHRIRKAAVRYKKFGIHGAPQAVLNSVSQALPAMILGLYFSPAVVGFYVMANRVVGAPLVLISQSLRQAMFPHFAMRLHSQEKIAPLLRKFTIGMALAGLPLLLLFTIFGEEIFLFVLGANWGESGRYAAWIVLWLWAGMINPAANVVLNILEQQRAHAVYEAFLLVARFAALSSAVWTGSALMTIALFSIVGLIFNLILVGLATFYARRHDHAIGV